MLRFFRKYLLNKWVLAIGGSLLMVVFLLPMGAGGFGSGGQNPVIGRFMPSGERVRASDLEMARAQLQVLERISPILRVTATTSNDELMQWVLLKRAAEQSGLAVSQEQAVLLLGELGRAMDNPAEIARQMGTSEAMVIQTLRDYGAVALYRELALGQSHLPLHQRVRQYTSIAMASGLAAAPQAPMLLPPRVSTPLIERFVYEQGSSLQVSMVQVAADRYIDQAPEPDEAQITALYDQYRDHLPGTSEPYGFGYRSPRRVKVEYLTIPAPRISDQVQFSEADALAYFAANRDRFQGFDAGASNTDAYLIVRDQVLAAYVREQAEELAQRIVARARAMMIVDLRRFDRTDGYMAIPDDYQPLPLAQVAETIEQEFGIRPNVSIRDQQWLDAQHLSLLPGIGEAWLLTPQFEAPFAAYVMSAREVEPADSRLLTERLQVNAPSRGLKDAAGNHYVFRLLDAASQRSPQSLDEVRQQVVHDARLLAAYQKLVSQAGDWLAKARQEGLASLAADLGADIHTPTAFTRNEMTAQGTLQPPMIPGIGRNASFVRQIFSAADALIGDQPVRQLPEAGRITTVPVAATTSLYVVRIDDVSAVTAAQLAEQTNSPMMPILIGLLLRPEGTEDPLSIAVLSRRLGYINAANRGEETSNDVAPPASSTEDAT